MKILTRQATSQSLRGGHPEHILACDDDGGDEKVIARWNHKQLDMMEHGFVICNRIWFELAIVQKRKLSHLFDGGEGLSITTTSSSRLCLEIHVKDLQGDFFNWDPSKSSKCQIT